MEKTVLRLVLLSAVCLLLFFLFSDNSTNRTIIIDNDYEIIDTDNDDYVTDVVKTKGKRNIGSFAIVLILSVIIILALSDVFVVKRKKKKVRRNSVLSDEELLKQVTYRTYLTYLNSLTRTEQLHDLKNDACSSFYENLEANLTKLKDSCRKIVVKDLEVENIKIDQLIYDKSQKPLSFVGIINARMQRYMINSGTGELIEGYSRNKHRHCASCYFELTNNEWKLNTIREEPTVF